MTGDRLQRIAGFLFDRFNRFYGEFQDIPARARVAFENRHHQESLRLSNLRIRLYSESIEWESREFASLYPDIRKDEASWADIDRRYRNMVAGEYHEDLAVAYLNSIRRKIFVSEWLVEDYSMDKPESPGEDEYPDCYIRVQVTGKIGAKLLVPILNLEKFQVKFEDIQRDATLVAERVNRNLRLEEVDTPKPTEIEMIRGGFYRNRGAYLVGRFNWPDGKHRPFIVALLNSDSGIFVDAVITSTTYAHNMFSSTLANFHVTNGYYHELCQFLKSIMPMRPIGLHYSTIGYNHLGKVAVMNEMGQEIRQHRERFDVSPGADGTVAIGFTTPSLSYHLKVIRNVPTDKYKWDEFDGVESVLRKYTRVHEINRSDSMLDSIIYYKLRLPKKWFERELIDQLLQFANHSIDEEDDALLFRYLIVQRKLTPLPVFLENASDRQSETIMKNLGYCIKNNAAANIFNKDLDARNYGVTAYSKVYLYDYDAIEDLDDVKIRTNLDRLDGEEDIPDWYFEDGYVFLPEELTAGLCLRDRDLRRVFENSHSELLTTRYWEGMQMEHAGGEVPRVSVYPDSEKISGGAGS